MVFPNLLKFLKLPIFLSLLFALCSPKMTAEINLVSAVFFMLLFSFLSTSVR